MYLNCYCWLIIICILGPFSGPFSGPKSKSGPKSVKALKVLPPVLPPTNPSYMHMHKFPLQLRPSSLTQLSNIYDDVINDLHIINRHHQKSINYDPNPSDDADPTSLQYDPTSLQYNEILDRIHQQYIPAAGRANSYQMLINLFNSFLKLDPPPPPSLLQTIKSATLESLSKTKASKSKLRKIYKTKLPNHEPSYDTSTAIYLQQISKTSTLHNMLSIYSNALSNMTMSGKTAAESLDVINEKLINEKIENRKEEGIIKGIERTTIHRLEASQKAEVRGQI